MNRIRVIQRFMKGDKALWPGEFIEDRLEELGMNKDEVQEMIETGYLTVKIVVEKKPKKKKKVKDDKNP